MTFRLLGLPEELRLAIEQAGGRATEEARVIIEASVQESVAQVEQTITESLREVQSIIGPHGTISRLQTGGIRIANGEGIGVYLDGVFKTNITPNGTVVIGSDISQPETTTEIFFVEDTNYNGEAFESGDFLIGNNSESNVKFDASEGQLQFRDGQTVKAYMDTDGSLKAGEGVVTLDDGGISIIAPDAAVADANSYKFVDASGNTLFSMAGYTGASGTIINAILQTLHNGDVTDSTLGLLTPTAGILLSTITDRITINSRSMDVDTHINWDSGTSINVDGGTGAVEIDYGLHVNSIYADKDTVISGDTTDVLTVDAGLEAVGIGGAAESGYKLKVTGKTNLAAGNTYDIDGTPHTHSLPNPFALTADTTPSALAANQNDYNPAGLSTADVLRLEASGADRSITGLQGGADGRIIVLYNIGATYDIFLLNEDTGSSEANRFAFGADVCLVPKAMILLQYDNTSSRWRANGIHSATLQGAPITANLHSGLDDRDMLFWDAESGFFDSTALFSDTEGDPAPVGTASDGTSNFAARRDHVHLGSIVVPETNTDTLFRYDNVATSAFAGTINGAPAGAAVTYTPVSGSETVLSPFASTQLAKMRLYNTTRGNSALILSCNTGTNVITLTAAAPVGWANGDTITIASQTVSGGAGNWVDFEITSGPTGKSGMFVVVANQDTTTAGQVLRMHPFSTYGDGNVQANVNQVAARTLFSTHLIKITGNVFTVSWTASGATTAIVSIRETGYIG
jgi:hypothetical protein